MTPIEKLREMLAGLSPSERIRFASLAAWMLEHPQSVTPSTEPASSESNDLLPPGHSLDQNEMLARENSRKRIARNADAGIK